MKIGKGNDGCGGRNEKGVGKVEEGKEGSILLVWKLQTLGVGKVEEGKGRIREGGSRQGRE